MGAACTTLTVPPATAKYINEQWGLTIKIPEASIQHLWRHMGPYIRDGRQRWRFRRELQKLLETNQYQTRFLVVSVRDEQRWTFEVLKAPPVRVASFILLE